MNVLITLEEGYKNKPKTLKALEKKGFEVLKIFTHINVIKGNLKAKNVAELLTISNKLMDIEGIIAVEQDETYYTLEEFLESDEIEEEEQL